MDNNWQKEFPAAITVCNANGIITYMNEKAKKTFEEYGGEKLIGTSLLDCHNEESKKKIKELMTGIKANVYTIEKNGQKKLIYQTPVFENGKNAGLVELSLEIPCDMPHFIRE